MATRGIIAHATENGWQGRYSHWDNYPEHIVGSLALLVMRDGVEKVVETLITNNASWSSIDPFASEENGHALVLGYGHAHTDVTVEDTATMFTHTDTELAWAEWLYIIHTDILEVRRIERDMNGNDVTVYQNAYTWDSITPKEVEV